MIGTLEGSVQVKTADGTVKPVIQATVDVYRVDIEQDLQVFQMKTDRSGNFFRVGVPGRGTFMIVACSPGLQWKYVRNVRMGEKTVVPIVANAGDGTCPSKRDLIEMGILQR